MLETESTLGWRALRALPSALVALIIVAWAFVEMIPISRSVASTVPAVARGQYSRDRWREFPSVNLRAIGLVLPHLWALVAAVALVGSVVLPKARWGLLIWPVTTLLLAGVHAVYLSSLLLVPLLRGNEELEREVWKAILLDGALLAGTDLVFLIIWWKWRIAPRVSNSDSSFPLELPSCLGAWLCLSWFLWLALTFGGRHLVLSIGLSKKPPDTFEWLYASPIPPFVLFAMQALLLRRRRIRPTSGVAGDRRGRSTGFDPAGTGSPGP